MKILVIILSILTMGGFAQGQNTDQTTSKVKLTKKKKKVGLEENAAVTAITGAASGWRVQGMVDHIPALRSDQEDTTQFLARVDYTFNKKHRVRVQQFGTKFYSKYASEYDFRPADTNLFHFYTPEWKPFGMRLMWRNGLSIPISNASVRDDLITTFSTAAIASKGFMKNKLLWFAIPYFRYHWYEYTTAVENTIPWYTIGMSNTALYFITSKWTVAGTVNYNYQPDRSRSGAILQERANKGLFRVDISTGYQFTPQIAANFGFFQGANYTEQGVYEPLVFDNQRSRVSMGLTYVY